MAVAAGAADVPALALVGSETVLVAVETAEALGSGSKLTCALKDASWPEQPPATALPPLLALPAVELCSVTSLTPSIRRRRWSVSATAVWLVAHPASVNVGTLPGGVAEATGVAALAAEAEEEVDVETEGVAVALEPIVPLREEIEASDGSTRPNS